MEETKRIDIVEMIINEINNRNYDHLNEEKLFLEMNKSLCNNVLYQDKKFKDNTIILTNIFRNIFSDMIKEVNNCINKEGVYKNE